MVRMLPLLLLACTPAQGVLRVPGDAEPTEGTSPPKTADPDDQDGDGWAATAGDCDDLDPGVHPKAPEVLGDGIDNDCRGQVYAAPTAYFEVTPTNDVNDVATATVVVTFYDEASEVLCSKAYTVFGEAGSGPDQVPDCPSCTAWLALDFSTAGEIPVTGDPDFCGHTVELEDPHWLGPATGDYWFGGMAMVDLETMRSTGIELYDWDADGLAADLEPWTATHVGALRAEELTGLPMSDVDQWEAGAWVAVDPTGNPNTGPSLEGEYTASAIYLLMLGD